MDHPMAGCPDATQVILKNSQVAARIPVAANDFCGAKIMRPRDMVLNHVI